MTHVMGFHAGRGWCRLSRPVVSRVGARASTFTPIAPVKGCADFSVDASCSLPISLEPTFHLVLTVVSKAIIFHKNACSSLSGRDGRVRWVRHREPRFDVGRRTSHGL